MATRDQRSFCRICIASCGIVVTVDEPTDGPPQVVRVRGDAEHPLSHGYTCPKGRALPRYHHHPDRLTRPVVRGRATSWDGALDDLAATVRAAVEAGGPEAVAVYSGSGGAFDAAGKATADRFLRALGSTQKYTSMTVDTPCKPLVSELVGGWSGLLPTLDVEGGDAVVLLVGTNPVVSHGHSNGISDPVTRLRTLGRRGGVWVVDPRSTETAAMATSLGGRHLRPRASTDWLVLAWLVRELLADGADRTYLADHTDAADLATLAAELAPFDLDVVTARTGVPAADLLALADAVRAKGRVAVATGTGTTMQRAANVVEWLGWCLQIVTGSLDREGGMWFNPGFLRQADRFPPRVGRGSARPGTRSRPELAQRFGEHPCSALVSEIEAGNVKVLVVVGGNAITALPDPERTAAALAGLDALAVLDVVDDEITRAATHVLPVLDQLERADVPVASDNLQLAVVSQHTAAVVPPTGDQRAAWWVLAELGRRVGLPSLLPGEAEPDAATDDQLLADLLARAALPLDRLVESPTAVVVRGPTFGWVRSSVLEGGRWRVVPDVLVAQLRELAGEEPDDLVLVPRRVMGLMNSQLRGVTVDDGGGVRLHPDDARARGLHDGDEVEVASASGRLRTRLHVDERAAPGTAAITQGWSDPSANALTSATHAVDPLTGMVHLSGVPVSVGPAPA